MVIGQWLCYNLYAAGGRSCVEERPQCAERGDYYEEENCSYDDCYGYEHVRNGMRNTG